MNKFTVEVPVDMDELVRHLTREQQAELSEKLWAMRIERLSRKMRISAHKNRVTPSEIEKMCEEARQKVYAKYCR